MLLIEAEGAGVIVRAMNERMDENAPEQPAVTATLEPDDVASLIDAC